MKNDNNKKVYLPPVAEIVVFTGVVQTGLSAFNVESKNTDWLFS